jgi:hypothetical protein
MTFSRAAEAIEAIADVRVKLRDRQRADLELAGALENLARLLMRVAVNPGSTVPPPVSDDATQPSRFGSYRPPVIAPSPDWFERYLRELIAMAKTNEDRARVRKLIDLGERNKLIEAPRANALRSGL